MAVSNASPRVVGGCICVAASNADTSDAATVRRASMRQSIFLRLATLLWRVLNLAKHGSTTSGRGRCLKAASSLSRDGIRRVSRRRDPAEKYLRTGNLACTRLSFKVSKPDSCYSLHRGLRRRLRYGAGLCKGDGSSLLNCIRELELSYRQ
jgi:hypothetical protein